ncbi:MAG: DUF1674 domain-containing protein [Pseudomonadota bacterium]|nr:DUF1674 domain-containing protein [Alphaproteobacteria bacterium]MCS5596349.1 DUF1674 domain-containing protein [Alphaproteobacteria bacterium]MEC7576884.1 DUF1674 domain-containing protein [Pseudomonadota bacterium]MEC7703373.1 DUF1674 domain-containing protein [Pseudomonadota bacterium]MEC9234882.1 DUF1674 domain-containing protein [Pseudomonadota bacterium]|tara:strand:+ start:396 stop:569 length:174 start_codon:yes stop_codon:yes gene_type:complete
MTKTQIKAKAEDQKIESTTQDAKESAAEREKEYGGRQEGLEPTRYGDWELKGKCVDF